jgi:hypothetical protein
MAVECVFWPQVVTILFVTLMPNRYMYNIQYIYIIIYTHTFMYINFGIHYFQRNLHGCRMCHFGHVFGQILLPIPKLTRPVALREERRKTALLQILSSYIELFAPRTFGFHRLLSASCQEISSLGTKLSFIFISTYLKLGFMSEMLRGS